MLSLAILLFTLQGQRGTFEAVLIRFTMSNGCICVYVSTATGNDCPDFTIFWILSFLLVLNGSSNDINYLNLSADPISIPGGSAVCSTQLVTNFPMLSVKQPSDAGPGLMTEARRDKLWRCVRPPQELCHRCRVIVAPPHRSRQLVP